MTLAERGRGDMLTRARLMLHARGVPRTAEALAGALLEAERDALMVAMIKGLAGSAK